MPERTGTGALLAFTPASPNGGGDHPSACGGTELGEFTPTHSPSTVFRGQTWSITQADAAQSPGNGMNSSVTSRYAYQRSGISYETRSRSHSQRSVMDLDQSPFDRVRVADHMGSPPHSSDVTFSSKPLMRAVTFVLS